MYYLDSCVCVNFLRGKLPGFRERLERTDPRLFGIPTVVQAELLLGAEKSRNPEMRHAQPNMPTSVTGLSAPEGLSALTTCL